MIQASIITIGDELMIGQVIDTNSAWIATELNKIGIYINRRIAVGDLKESIIKALDNEIDSSDIILVTGGLGPTSDDITKQVLAEYFNSKLITDENVLNDLKKRYELFKRPLTEINLSQAEVPDKCIVIRNTCGSAPGMLFKKNNKSIISMPGVPFEMKEMMKVSILPLFKKEFGLPPLQFRTLLTAGIAESDLAEKIKNFEDLLPEEIKLAYLPHFGMVRLRLSAPGNFSNKVLDNLFNQLQNSVVPFLVINEDISIEEAIGRMLIKNNQTLSTAESCTGGYLAHKITLIPGSSAFFKGGLIVYSNEVKQQLLNVKSSTIEKYGAVSEETVKEMLDGALKRINSDYTIAISGIMGPGGGTEDKPIGTVWIGVANKDEIMIKKFFCRYDRERNIEITSIYAFNLLRTFINKDSI